MAAELEELDPAVGLLSAEPFRRIGDVANRTLPQVSPWMPACDAALVLRVAGAEEALVADGDGTPLGMVTAQRLDAAPPGAGIGQLMTPLAAVLHESVPLVIARSLMASLPASRIAVVSDGRRAIGVLSAEACHLAVAPSPTERRNPDGTRIALSSIGGDEP